MSAVCPKARYIHNRYPNRLRSSRSQRLARDPDLSLSQQLLLGAPRSAGGPSDRPPPMSSPPSLTPLPASRTTSMGHDNPTPQSWGPPTSYATKSDKLVCVMVGLPARGKSYISRRLAQYVSFFYGAPTKVFNVGDYRRKVSGGSFHSAEYFDARNAEAAEARHRASADALHELSAWMAGVTPNRVDSSLADTSLSGDFGALAIFDATNSTRERRAWIVDQLKSTGAKVIFIESICRDEKLVAQNILHAKVGQKDYAGVETAAAVADFQERISKYEEVYEELGPEERHLTWIKITDGGRELSMNNIRGFLEGGLRTFVLRSEKMVAFLGPKCACGG